MAPSQSANGDDFENYYPAPTVIGLTPQPAAGPASGGTRVTIAGANLTHVTTVYFGSVAADLSSLAYNVDGTITITSPAHPAGSVDVTVVTPGGTSPISSANQFIYVAAPTVSSLAPQPAAGPVSGGARVTIAGANLSKLTSISITAVYFGSVPASRSSLVYNADGTISITSPVHAAGAVDVTVVTTGGTSAISPADQFTYLAPTVTGLSPKAGPEAGGTSVTITGANLANLAEVDFGSVAASRSSLKYNADGSITVTSPAQVAGAWTSHWWRSPATARRFLRRTSFPTWPCRR